MRDAMNDEFEIPATKPDRAWLRIFLASLAGNLIASTIAMFLFVAWVWPSFGHIPGLRPQPSTTPTPTNGILPGKVDVPVYGAQFGEAPP